MTSPIYISYYTLNSPYEDHAAALAQTLRSFGLLHKIYAVPSRGSWLKNVLIKPEIIQAALREFSRPIVYVDADARLVDNPTLFDELDCDFGVYARKQGGLSFFNSTLYWGTSPLAMDLLKNWHERCILEEKPIRRSLPAPYFKVCETNWMIADQAPLVNAYLHFKYDLGKEPRVFYLPKSYAVKARSKHNERVIVQLQTSNMYRDKIR